VLPHACPTRTQKRYKNRGPRIRCDAGAIEPFSLLQKKELNRHASVTRDQLQIAIAMWCARADHRRRRQDAVGRLIPIENETAMTTTATMHQVSPDTHSGPRWKGERSRSAWCTRPVGVSRWDVEPTEQVCQKSRVGP
jgi:hypothetical protein